MSRWDRYVLRPRVRAETSESESVPHIGPYTHAHRVYRAHGAPVHTCHDTPCARGYAVSSGYSATGVGQAILLFLTFPHARGPPSRRCHRLGCSRPAPSA